MNDITIRNISEADIDRVNEFYNHYHKAGRDYAKFRWEFINCPQGRGIYTLAEESSTKRILGIQGGIPYLLISNTGTEILTIKSEDSLIDVDACAKLKRKDVFKQLYSFFITQCKDQGINIVWGFTWARNSLLRIGFQIPFNISMAVLVLKPNPAIKYLASLNPANGVVQKVKITGLSAWSFLTSIIGRLLYDRQTNFKITEELVSGLELLEHIPRERMQIFFTRQDVPYLEWRIISNPYPLKYRIYNFYRNNCLSSQIISSINKEKVAYIEQILFDETLNNANKIGILYHVVSSLRKKGAILIRHMSFDNNSYSREQNEVLKKVGLVFLKRGMGFIFLPLSEKGNLVDPASLFLSRLYTQGHA